MRTENKKGRFRRTREKPEEVPHGGGKRRPGGKSPSGSSGRRAQNAKGTAEARKDLKENRPCPEGLKDSNRLERENEALVRQLIQASSMVREMEEKAYEGSRKQTLGRVMVAGLLHDLRNPLAVISSCAQSCLEEQEENAPLREKLQIILESVKKASDLANSFLNHTKTSILDYGPVNINRTLLLMWKMSTLQSAPRKVNFAADLDKALPEITGSQENLERVFLNIFMNAIHAVSANGKVNLQTRFLPLDKTAEIKITDDGPGIPPEQRNRIFEPFYTTKEEGTGLGLNISQSLVLQHGGQITLDSEVGEGTAVTIKLPMAQDDSPGGITATAVHEDGQ